MGQYRDKFFAENAGLPFTFPPLESKKRKRPTTPTEPTRKPRSAGLVALSRVSNLPRSHSTSDDSDSNTSSAEEARATEDWAGPTPAAVVPKRTSLRRRNLRHNSMYVALEDVDIFGPSEEEDEWVR